jgi:hypothetical protein
MIFFTSACDFPQNEHRVMREDLAIDAWQVRRSRVGRHGSHKSRDSSYDAFDQTGPAKLAVSARASPLLTSLLRPRAVEATTWSTMP